MSGTSTATQRIPTIEVVVACNLDAFTAPTVKEALDRAMSLHPQQLIVDLAQCPSIDAAGILLLLDAHRRAMRDGGTVALRSPSPKLQRNLRLAKVDRVLRVLATYPSPCPPTHDGEERQLLP